MTEVSPQSVVVRAARESELPAILELLCAAFGEQVRPRMHAMLWGDSSLRLEDLRVAALGDELVACVRIADRPIHYGAATLRMGGIGAVATNPAHQHHGYASLVLRDAENVMRRAGYDLGMLFTGIAPFYARLGWVPFPEHFAEWRVDRDAAMVLPEPRDVRAFDEQSDLAVVERIYDADSAQRVGPCARSAAHWRDEHSQVLGIMPSFVVEQANEVVAYASLCSHESRLEVNEAACRPGATRAFEPLAVQIWREARTSGTTTLSAHLPRGHGLRATLQHYSHSLRQELTQSWMMLHVLELGTLLQAATPELKHRLAVAAIGPGQIELGLRVEEDFARLVVEDGEVRIDNEPASRELAIPTELFFRIFLGEQTVSVLREQLALDGIFLSEWEQAMLDVLFPRRDPIYWRADHF